MPRKSFQAFSDVNTKVQSHGYVTGAAAENAAKGGKAGKVQTEIIEEVRGSCAGAGSGEFHKYIGARNREKDRIEEIEAAAVALDAAAAYRAKVEQNQRLNEERARKNAEKRKRAKARKQLTRKKQKTDGSAVAAAGVSDDNGTESNADSDAEKETEGTVALEAR